MTASFVGSSRSFKRHFGPRMRNLVQLITKSYRLRVGKCEHCGLDSKLEAAHVHGKGRNHLIDSILSKHIHKDVVTVDLNLFESEFKDAHNPIEDNILILCRECHSKYDAALVGFYSKYNMRLSFNWAAS